MLNILQFGHHTKAKIFSLENILRTLYFIFSVSFVLFRFIIYLLYFIYLILFIVRAHVRVSFEF